MAAEGDPVLRELRERVAEADGRLLEVVAERIELVQAIRAHKREHGLDLHDPDQERRLVAVRQRENRGPLSAEGVAELLRAVLDLTRRELDRRES